MLTSPSNTLHSTPHLWPIRRSNLCRSRNFPRFGGNLCSLSLLSARSGASRFSIRALVRPEDGDSGSLSFPNHISVKIPFGNREILVETGLMGRQASSSVTVTDGETIVCTSVCVADVPSEPSDFLPLYVHYQERFSAVGRTSGGFFKREGKTKDHEVLICRLIDRPLRPTMPKGFYNETQILSWFVAVVLLLLSVVALTSGQVEICHTALPPDDQFHSLAQRRRKSPPQGGGATVCVNPIDMFKGKHAQGPTGNGTGGMKEWLAVSIFFFSLVIFLLL